MGRGMIAEKEKWHREYVPRYHKPGQPLDFRRRNNKKEYRKRTRNQKGGKEGIGKVQTVGGSIVLLVGLLNCS